jgi:hypothetical protein
VCVCVCVCPWTSARALFDACTAVLRTARAFGCARTTAAANAAFNAVWRGVPQSAAGGLHPVQAALALAMNEL